KSRDAGEPLLRLIAECLRKNPSERPRSAATLLQLLGSGQTPRPRFRRRAIIVAAVILVLLAATATYAAIPPQTIASLRTLISRRPAVLHVNRVIVTPFENHTGDPRLEALGPMLADYVGEGLSRIGRLEVLDART